MSWVEWIDDPLRPARDMLLAHRRARGDTVEDDGRVEIWPENAEAAEVYMRCRNQVVSVGMSGVADLSIPAVKVVMDLLGVEDQRACLLQVQRTFDYFTSQRTTHAH